MLTFLIILFCIFFAIITLYQFNLGLFFLFLLLPTYLIRFNLGPLPTTLLEVMIWIILVVWIVKYRKNIIYHLSFITKKHLSFFIAASLFLLAATISIFTSVNIRAAAGEWKAFYIEPFLIFLVLAITLKQWNNGINEQSDNTSTRQHINTIIFALILCGLATSILTIYQHFTGWMVPWDFWENGKSFRVTGWYGYPNAVGLFLAPLVPLAIYLIIQSFEALKKKMGKGEGEKGKVFLIFLASFLFPLSSFLAISFAKSTSGLVGIAAGIGLLLLFYKKTRLPAIFIGLVSIVSILSLSSLSGIRDELTFQDRSGQIRIAVWKETIKFLSDHPILGTGLASYEKRIVPYHTTVNSEGIEIFHHPHNIFLTIWVNLGLLGLIGFLWILVWFFKKSFAKIKRLKDYKTDKKTIFQFFNLSIFLLASMTVIIVTGLVDSPYIKNDLAILFWLLPAILIISTNTPSKEPE